MRIALISNPKSGSGRAAAFTPILIDYLSRAGHAVTRFDARDPAVPGGLHASDAALILGGDGSIHHLLPALLEARTPFYHVPMGTENLFARQFGMSRRLEQVIGALERNSPVTLDAGFCNDRPFVLMLSIGPDAGVMRRLASTRTGTISHLSYLVPVLREAIAPSLAPITLRVDGAVVVDREQGMLVIANSSQYALRINPAHHAKMDDARLEVIFIPARTTAALVYALALSRFRRLVTTERCRLHSCESLHIEAPLSPVQIDGESCPFDATDLSIKLVPGALRILRPVHWIA